MSTNVICPCGSLYIPIGSKYNPNGLSLRLYYNDTYLDLKLVHNQDSYLSSGETFVSTTENITLNEPIIIKNIVLYHGNTYNLQINDIIKIVCKSFNSKNILGLINIGSLGQITSFNNNIINNKKAIDIDGSCLNNTLINLYNDKIQLEIYSICDFFAPVCCDNTPNSMSLTNKINHLSIPCCSSTTTTTTTTTTTPPSGACCERGFTWDNITQSYTPFTNCLGILTEQQCSPYISNDSQRVWISGQFCESCDDLDFCSRFFLPSSFNLNIIDYGDFGEQETYITVIKNANTYSSSGNLPCGTYFELRMSCDEINEEFIYDGTISCCNQLKKWVHDPTKMPLMYPNARIPLLVGYSDCSNCIDCITTTTSTTPPPLPCGDTTFGPLTINGYAFYRKSNRTINIPGIGPVRIKCSGGHRCNRTNFIPRLILNSITIDAQPINLNNLNDGENKDATFLFNLPDITLLQDGADIQLQCTTNNCHQGITAVILTTEIDGVTKLLFNSCVFPNEIDNLEYTCNDYCNIIWTSIYSCSTSSWSQPQYTVLSSKTKAIESTEWSISGVNATWNNEGILSLSDNCSGIIPIMTPTIPTIQPCCPNCNLLPDAIYYGYLYGFGVAGGYISEDPVFLIKDNNDNLWKIKAKMIKPGCPSWNYEIDISCNNGVLSDVRHQAICGNTTVNLDTSGLGLINAINCVPTSFNGFIGTLPPNSPDTTAFINCIGQECICIINCDPPPEPPLIPIPVPPPIWCNTSWTSTYNCNTLSWNQPVSTTTSSYLIRQAQSIDWTINGNSATFNSQGILSFTGNCNGVLPQPPATPNIYPGGCPSWLRAHGRIGNNLDTVEQQLLLGPTTVVPGSTRNAEWNPNQTISTLENGGYSNPANYISYGPTTSSQNYIFTYDPITKLVTWKLSNAATQSVYTVPVNKLNNPNINYPLSIFVAAVTGRPAGSFPTCSSFTRIDSCLLQVVGEPAIQIPIIEVIYPPGSTDGFNRTYNTQAKLGKGFTISGTVTIGWNVIRPRGSNCQFWFSIIDPF